ncbi:unnamed protein product [Schistosoma mattheei]|uniref:Uncharacterized protein n=1 Tax=Schistosoma mattheei TaxID=31246 RepID=A0A183PC07_9TREM|nr:unnamed protein product [Schistosoma mattheei]
MKDAVDAQLRDQQAGFRKDRSCTDRIAKLWIIVKQLVEWNSSLYINFIDYEKAAVQGRAWRTADRCIPSKDRRQTRLSTLSLPLSSGG